MRYLGSLVVCVACSGPSTAPIGNTAKPACSVIPDGEYMFGGARTQDELMAGDTESGRCSTPYEGGVQQLRCAQGSVQLRGALEQRKDGVHVAGFEGVLEYSDAVVLIGTLHARDGATLAVRLELRCPSVDACMAALKDAHRCR
jgi:hypothetical protein